MLEQVLLKWVFFYVNRTVMYKQTILAFIGKIL